MNNSVTNPSLSFLFNNLAIPSTYLPPYLSAKLPVGARLYRTGGAVHMEPTSWMRAFWIGGLLSIPQVHCQSPARLCSKTFGDFGDWYLVLVCAFNILLKVFLFHFFPFFCFCFVFVDISYPFSFCSKIPNKIAIATVWQAGHNFSVAACGTNQGCSYIFTFCKTKTL